jgi:hypothetical protein
LKSSRKFVQNSRVLSDYKWGLEQTTKLNSF